MTTLTKKAQAEQEREEAKAYLLELFAGEESPRVQTILRHVSASGMSRDISVIYKGENITWHTACALGEILKYKNGFGVIRMTGCGMDMGFALIYNLSGVIYGWEDRKGYTLKQEWL